MKEKNLQVAFDYILKCIKGSTVIEHLWYCIDWIDMVMKPKGFPSYDPREVMDKMDELLDAVQDQKAVIYGVGIEELTPSAEHF